jgi:hypothetical protein
VISLTQGLYLYTNTEKHINTEHPCLCVGFEPMVPASERVKTVEALDRSVTVTGNEKLLPPGNK